VRDIRRIIIHCSATNPSMDIGAPEIERWHRDRGWNGIGYHWVIRRSGDVESGRSEAIAGAHVAGHNSDSIGICLVGGVDAKNRPDSNFTRHQWAALDHLVTQLLIRFPGAEVSGHRDWTDAKACPSFDVKSWWPRAVIRP
jgi:N-acetylmuramoyl-L-alanine amidase